MQTIIEGVRLLARGCMALVGGLAFLLGVIFLAAAITEAQNVSDDLRRAAIASALFLVVIVLLLATIAGYLGRVAAAVETIEDVKQWEMEARKRRTRQK